jgi:hypothetical protein
MAPGRIDYMDGPPADSVVPSANVVVVNDEGQILLIRRTDNGNIALPSGGMDLMAVDRLLVREAGPEPTGETALV